MQSHPRHTLSCRESPGRWLQALGWKLSAFLLRKVTQTLTRRVRQERAGPHEPKLHANLQDRNIGYGAAHTVCISGPKSQSINPLVSRPELSAFTHEVMNHEGELSDAPTDTLL